MSADPPPAASARAHHDGAGPHWRGSRSVLLCLLLLVSGCIGGAELVLASTTSTEDSGLFDVLLPAFAAAHPQYRVKLIAVGTGQALALGARGDADVLLVHAPAAEAAFIAAGHGSERRVVMHNRFVLLAPDADPAGAVEAADACGALRWIAAAGATFVSRGDDSGTHKKERELWQCAGVAPRGPAYVDVGQGMGETLAIASERRAYTLSDEATFRVLRPEGLRTLALEDSLLRNPYSIIIVRAARHSDGARAFAAWMAGPGKQVIADFGRDRFGAPLFRPEP